jgi:hypothetical protein
MMERASFSPFLTAIASHRNATRGMVGALVPAEFNCKRLTHSALSKLKGAVGHIE